MERYQWTCATDRQSAHRRAGGRRRYNAMRKRQAEARREAMAEALAEMGAAALLTRGLAPSFARAFGVSRQTAWRDLQYILYGGRTYNFWRGDELLFPLTRAYPGGPVLSLTDPEGYEMRGQFRRRILRTLPRYLDRRW
jgi:hypothetical protein